MFKIDTDEINNDYLHYMEDQRETAIEQFRMEKQFDSREEIPRVEPEKIKKRFGKQISAHANRAKNINGDKDYKSYVYLDKRDKRKIIKVYEYDDDILDLVFSYEVFMQNKAYAAKCDVKIPLISEYGTYSEDSKHYFFIVMAKINYESLDQYLSHAAKVDKALVKKINDANECLIDHQVSHNDLHEENILVNKDSIAFIDFGNAGPTVENFDEPITYEKLKKIKASKKTKTKRLTKTTSKQKPSSNRRPKSAVTQ
jgi:tRNA A-37 threonylcarbamoyl transferase component Bud32